MKRRLVVAVLVALAIWPLLQFFAVRRFDVDAWKLAGFAMYSVPGPQHLVRVVGLDSRGRQLPLHRNDYDPELRSLVTDYHWRRMALGRLASDRALAQHLLEARPSWDAVAIVVAIPALDRETAMVTIDFDRQIHWREARETGDFHLTRERMLELFSS